MPTVVVVLILTIYRHQYGGLSFRLVAGHGGVDVLADVVAVPPHPLPVPNEDGVGRRHAWKRRRSLLFIQSY